MTLSKNIQALRLQNKLTQEEFGELLGVSAELISKWEEGKGSPDISYLPLIAKQLRVTIESLFQGEITKKCYGYGGERQELLALYESGTGSEKDFRKAVDAYNEVILNGKAVMKDYFEYGLLHQLHALKEMEIAKYYYQLAFAEREKQ